MAPKIQSFNPELNAKILAAKETLKQIDPQLVEKAMQNMVEDLKGMGPLIQSYFKTANEFLYAGGFLGVRTPETEGRAMRAQIEPPTKYFESHFNARDTSQKVDRRLMGTLLTHLDSAVEKKWFTSEQGEALKFIFGLSLSPDKMETQNQFSSSQPGGAGTFQERNMQQDHSQNSEEEEYQMFFEEMEGRDASRTPRSGASARMMGGATARQVPTPPAPPSASSGSRAGSAYTSLVQNEENYLEANFSHDDPYYLAFKSFLPWEGGTRNAMLGLIEQEDAFRRSKQDILAQLAGLKTDTAEGAKQLIILQQKLGDVNNSEREVFEKIQRLQQAQNERKELMKNLFEIDSQARNAVLHNMGR